MINSEKFTKRLQKVIDYYGESASSFAEKIGVQRSSISHILSGRNKPSLEFVLKVVKAFPEVNLYWLLNGKGAFPDESTEPLSPTPEFSSKTKSTPSVVPGDDNKAIDKIIIFYKDGSFQSYETNRNAK